MACMTLHNLCTMGDVPLPDAQPQPEPEPAEPENENELQAEGENRAALLRQGVELRDRLVALVNG